MEMPEASETAFSESPSSIRRSLSCAPRDSNEFPMRNLFNTRDRVNGDAVLLNAKCPKIGLEIFRGELFPSKSLWLKTHSNL